MGAFTKTFSKTFGSVQVGSKLNVFKQVDNYALIQNFDDIDDISYTYGTFVTKEISTDYVIDGAGSLKIETGGTTCDIDFPVNNLKFPSDILFRFFAPTDTTLTSFYFYVYRGTEWAQATVQLYEGKGKWNNRIIKRSDFTAGTPAILDDPTTEITKVRIKILANKGPVYIDSMRFGGPQKPVVSIMFDDQHNSIMAVNDAVFGEGKSAFDYMKDRGIKGTIYVISGNVDNGESMTLSQLQQVYNAGWDLGNHTETHPTLTTLTNEQITSEISACDSFLAVNGFNRARKHFAYPAGAYNDEIANLITGTLGFETARTIEAYWINNNYKPYNLNYLFAKGVNSTITAANVTDRIDHAITEGRMFATYIHAIRLPEDSYSWSPENFKTIIDYVKTKKDAGEIEVLTISEWYRSIVKQ